MYRNKKLTQFARDRACTLRIPGVCDGGGETSVWAHSNSQRHGKGMGIKAHDIFGCIACHGCHQWLDTSHELKYDKEALFREAWERSLIEAANAGVLG